SISMMISGGVSWPLRAACSSRIRSRRCLFVMMASDALVLIWFGWSDTLLFIHTTSIEAHHALNAKPTLTVFGSLEAEIMPILRQLSCTTVRRWSGCSAAMRGRSGRLPDRQRQRPPGIDVTTGAALVPRDILTPATPLWRAVH